MNRFVQVSSLALPPGHCLACRKGESAHGFVDLGISDEWIGAFYLCAECVIEMARLWGLRTVEEMGDLDREVLDLRHRLADVLGELTQLHAVRKAIAHLREMDARDEPDLDDGSLRTVSGRGGGRSAGRGVA